ncbi:MAG: hypothetical protein MZV70_69075 [Desulfobacterales bacterium]|nr:hypothetical protein [Desulfobacterales bacterium]
MTSTLTSFQYPSFDTAGREPFGAAKPSPAMAMTTRNTKRYAGVFFMMESLSCPISSGKALFLPRTRIKRVEAGCQEGG